MARNRMSDLKDHLFAAIERLSDETLTTDQIADEAKRAEAIVSLADQITEGYKTQLVAARLFADHGEKILPMLPAIGKAPEGPAQ